MTGTHWMVQFPCSVTQPERFLDMNVGSYCNEKNRYPTTVVVGSDRTKIQVVQLCTDLKGAWMDMSHSND